MHILVLFALLAQSTPPPTGRMVEKVACPSDPTQTYTLYLPSAYTTDRQWPLLFVFDPRGRGTFAAEIFRDAAEKFGWIIASSDNTQSDGEWEPNRRALSAMWPDVPRAYAVDPKRIYAAGFSGGATVAWVLGRASGSIAGVLASGAPFPGAEAPKPVEFAWFATAGRADFNFLDAKTNDAWMADAGNPHRIEYFDGAHQWLPRPLAMRGVGWLEGQAMKKGLRPRDPALIASLVEAEVTAARESETGGDLTGAHRTYSAVVETYGSFGDVSAARERLRALEDDGRYKRAVRDETKADERERARKGELGAALVRFMTGDIDTLPELLGALKTTALLKDAKGNDYESASAQRTLEQIYVQTAFYIWRDYEAKKDFRRASILLDVATTIHPDRANVWINLAADRARMGARGPAIKALERAVETGFKDAGALEADERFAALQSSSDFAALLRRLKGF